MYEGVTRRWTERHLLVFYSVWERPTLEFCSTVPLLVVAEPMLRMGAAPVARARSTAHASWMAGAPCPREMNVRQARGPAAMRHVWRKRSLPSELRREKLFRLSSAISGTD